MGSDLLKCRFQIVNDVVPVLDGLTVGVAVEGAHGAVENVVRVGRVHAIRAVQSGPPRKQVVSMREDIRALCDCLQPAGDVVAVGYGNTPRSRHLRTLPGAVVFIGDHRGRVGFRRQPIIGIIDPRNDACLRIVKADQS